MGHTRAKGHSRRVFLQSVAAGAPTLSLMLQETRDARRTGEPPDGPTSSKFTPLDLSRYFNCSPAGFGPRAWAKGAGGQAAKDALIRTPAGRQVIRGIPFLFGPGGLNEKSWLVLSTRPSSWVTGSIDIPLPQQLGCLCLVAFCEFDENEAPPAGKAVIERVGQHLGDAVYVYQGGAERVLPLRRRFELDSPAATHACFGAFSLNQYVPLKLSDSLPSGAQWGFHQTSVGFGPNLTAPDGSRVANVWLCALGNPDPTRALKAVRLEARGDDPVVICGLTAFHGQQDPLRYQRLSIYRLTLPEASAEDQQRWKVELDLGVIARNYVLNGFEPQAWLSTPRKGLGEISSALQGAKHLYVELTASPEATLSLRDTKTGKHYVFDLARVRPHEELEARERGAHVEILEQEKVWLHATVVDSGTSRPTPVRLAFRSKEGRYIPPYGHRTEVNNAWFEDYGADLKLMDTPFAYVDGTLQVELPVGEVYLEMTKGFEYEAVRQKLQIKPGQRELRLEIPRRIDLRSQGWVTADTHVHFLSPPTAVLEGQAEGLNLINLLAAQWGDLFTNVGDFNDLPLTSRDGETIVRMGTENRQHMLGHISLLGGHGEPVYPMSAAGPMESYLGDPVWTSMAEWADTCRQREGVVIAPHFSYPTVEIAADIVLGKIDAVEVFPWGGDTFNKYNYREWYHYLNCGYRVPAVGGTDKMSTNMAVGASRTYAYIGREEFSFANWAKAVRAGNTFQTTGPLLFFRADGHVPGDTITLGLGGGTVEVNAEARCFVPIHRLEVVLNGQVVARREENAGTLEMSLNEKIRVPGPAWLAARCHSQVEPTAVIGGTWSYAITAHTSPVYVQIPGQELFSTAVAAYMLTLIEGAEAWLDRLAIRPDPEQFEKVRKTFREARERLHRRLHQCV